MSTTTARLGAVLILVPVWLSAGGSQVPPTLASTWGLNVLAAIVSERQNVVLPIDDYRLVNFERDLLSEYRGDSVRRTGNQGRIAATVNVSGEYFPAFILYDSSGKEAVALFVDEVQRGTAVADWDDNNQRLFFLPERIAFKPGSVVELRALNSDGQYRTETLLLLKEKPAARQRAYSIRQVEARAGASGAASLTWITSWPAACTVEWAAEGATGGKVTEDASYNNHRVALPGLAPGRRYRFRIVASTPEGASVTSPWQSFDTNPQPARTGSVQKGRVELKVADPLESGWKGEAPVSSGVPFPKGVLGSDQELRLLDAAGREVPVQAKTLGRWEDASTKWALFDFQAPAGGRYAVEYGAQVRRSAPATGLKVTQDKQKVEIVTGPLKLEVHKARYGFPGTVWMDGNRDGRFDSEEIVVSPQDPGAFQLTDAAGAAHTSLAPPDEVVVEDSGPLRATVRISGGHHAAGGRRLFAYTIRIHAYAGRPFLRVQHTFGNDAGAVEFTTIRSLTLRLPLVSSMKGAGRHWWTLGPPAAQLQPLRADQKMRLAQYRDNHFAISDGSRTIAEGRRAEGAAGWSDGVRSVVLAVRDFWQSYPKDLAVSAKGFELGLSPPLASDEYAGAEGTMDAHRLYYYMQGGGYKLRQGVSKTHDIWLGFSAAAAPQPEPPALERPPLTPFHAAAPADWYSASKAFGELAPRRPTGVLNRYDGAFDRSFSAYLANREINREYGMLNFGDWWGEREINWGNSEYDTQHAFFLQFARTGDWRYYRTGEEMEWHNRDVDTVHHHRDNSRLGGVYAHCVGHTGDYYQESPVKGRGITRGGMSVSHTFIEGHLGYYFLSGDLRSYETARRIADRFDAYETKNYDFTNCRNPGWHLILTMAMYNASYDPYYLNAARIIVERVLERQTPDGGWKRQLVPGHCQCLPRHHGEAGFMVAVLLTGLKYYYQATGDERVAQSIIRGSHFLIDDMWLPDINGFRYTSCPRSFTGAWSNFLLFDGISFAHQRTGDEKLGNVLRRGTGSALDSMTGWGKGFTQYTRVAPSFIGYLADLQKD
ncbi:MAG: hypothetical protein AAB225_23075 [Acidobacteriota bacterium]